MQRRVVTVFGGSGFIGRHLVRRLAAQDAIVRVAVRNPEAAQFLKPMGNAGQIVPIRATIDDDALVAAAVAGADAVVNLVGILAESGKRTFQRVHVDGAERIAMAARRAGVRQFVQISAIGADPESPAAYGRSKAAGEAAVREAFPEAVILRPSVVFGPEDGFFNLFAGLTRISWGLPVIGATMAWPKRGHDANGVVNLDLCGSEGPRMQPVFVGDVAEAIARVLDDAKAAGRTYELGGPRIYTFKALMALLLAVIQRRRMLYALPYWLATFQAWFLEKLPIKLLTRDQVKLLTRDNVVSDDALTLQDLGIRPQAAEVILPTYLHRFRTVARQDRLIA